MKFRYQLNFAMADEKQSKHAKRHSFSEEVLPWLVDLEVSLFYSMKGHKPVGEITSSRLILAQPRLVININNVLGLGLG